MRRQRRARPSVLVVGAPLRAEQGLFNAAVVIHRGRILGASPRATCRSTASSTRSASSAPRATCSATGSRSAASTVPFGNDLLFSATDVPDLTLHVEICEDLWVADPAEHVRRARRRDGAREPVGQQHHGRQVGLPPRAVRRAFGPHDLSAYIYTAAGRGESTTDLAWDGQAMIYENGDLLAEAERYPLDDHLITADVDLDRLIADRAETQLLGRLDPRPPPSVCGGSAGSSSSSAPPSGTVRLCASRRALPVRARRPPLPQRALRGGLPDPGRGLADPASRRPGSRSS